MNRLLQSKIKSLDSTAPVQRQASSTSLSGLHSLHQAYGNRAVGRLLTSQADGAVPIIQRKPDLAGMVQSVDNKVEDLKGKQLDVLINDAQDDIQTQMFAFQREMIDAIYNKG